MGRCLFSCCCGDAGGVVSRGLAGDLWANGEPFQNLCL